MRPSSYTTLLDATNHKRVVPPRRLPGSWQCRSKGPALVWGSPGSSGVRDGIQEPVTSDGVHARSPTHHDHDGRRQSRDLDGRRCPRDQLAGAGVTLAQGTGNLLDTRPAHQRVGCFRQAVCRAQRPARHGRRRRDLVWDQRSWHQRGTTCVVTSHAIRPRRAARPLARSRGFLFFVRGKMIVQLVVWISVAGELKWLIAVMVPWLVHVSEQLKGSSCHNT
jgi:hypothetical protein